jgi:hypothetical protein
VHPASCLRRFNSNASAFACGGGTFPEVFGYQTINGKYGAWKMMEHPIPGLIVFGVLLAITLYGLFRSNAASNRIDASEGRFESQRPPQYD